MWLPYCPGRRTRHCSAWSWWRYRYCTSRPCRWSWLRRWGVSYRYCSTRGGDGGTTIGSCAICRSSRAEQGRGRGSGCTLHLRRGPSRMFTPNGTNGGCPGSTRTVAGTGTGTHSTRRRRRLPLSSPLLPLLRWLWRLICIVLANPDPLRISVGVGKLVLAGGLVVLLDYAHVPLLVHWPVDANALPDHAVGAESSFDCECCGCYE
jgi:hypothetical protein